MTGRIQKRPAISSGARARTPDPVLVAGLHALVARLGRVQVARYCGVAPLTVRLWCFIAPGLKSLELLRFLAQSTDGFGDFAEQLAPMIEDKRRRWEWARYEHCSKLFALAGRWPASRQERSEFRRMAPRRPNGQFGSLTPGAARWGRQGGATMRIQPHIGPSGPPPLPLDFPEHRVAGVKALLERAGWTLMRGFDGGWHPVQLGGWSPPR